MVAFPKKDFVRGMKMLKMAFTDKKDDLGGLAKEIVELASVARRDGVLALEGKLSEIKDPFLRKALGYVVDGVDASVTRSSLEAAMEADHGESMQGAKVWESLGGFAPTIGIIGAVLGLIHVMENLSDPSKLGGGIATAFVATVYGVASANSCSHRRRARSAQAVVAMERISSSRCSPSRRAQPARLEAARLHRRSTGARRRRPPERCT
jgi:chemotaxis protein MotA